MSKCRSFDEILNSPDTIQARRAIEQLSGGYHITDLELRLRVEWFRACEWIGSEQRWSARFKISRSKARRLAHRLKEDAGTLNEALTDPFRFAIGRPLTVDLFWRLVNFVAVNWIEASLKETDDRKADWTLEPKRELTQFVWRKTRKPLDGLLADLTGALLRTSGYTAEDQRKFRARHCRLEGTDSSFPPTPKPDRIRPIND
jgi:hypothetical protein